MSHLYFAGRWAAVVFALFLCSLPVSAQEIAETNELFFFLGRFHPIVLHFPVALLVVLLMAEVITLGGNQSRETSVAKWLLLIVASVTSVTSATFGVFLSWSGGYDVDLIWWHYYLGISVAVLTVLATLLKTQYNRLDTIRFRIAYWVVLLAAVGVLAPASHYGASITHGTTYLTKYLPEELEFLRPILGEAELPVSMGSSDGLYAREILPILEAKCYECHSVEKQKGDYRMDDPAWCFEGGESGIPAIVPSDAMASHLVKLILLPDEHEDVMPPAGKPMLTGDETLALVRWINRGAPFGDFTPPPVTIKEESDVEVAVVGDQGDVVQLIDTDETMEALFEGPLETLRAALVDEPKGRRGLKTVYNAAYAIAESHNLLFSRDDEEYMGTPEWSALTVAGRDAAEAVIEPLMDKDYPGTKDAFALLVKSCNDCHDHFETGEDAIEDIIPSPDAAEAVDE